MSTHAPYTLRSAVLFITFRRDDTARAVFEAIRAARPARLYFASDAPRPGRPEEAEAVARVRALADQVDWPCQVFARFSEVNQGVKHGPWNAMDWFFAHEEEGIILEDDCLPAPSWWRFADDLLAHYRHDARVWAIIGNNLMDEWPGRPGESYYYTAHGYGAYWGWASWRRTWQRYDLAMKDWPALRDSGLLRGHFLSRNERIEACGVFESSWNGTITGWDFQFDHSRILHGTVNILPNVNLIRNIGFDGSGTNTVSTADPRNKANVADVAFPLQHPRFFLVDRARDLAYFQRYIEPSTYRKLKFLIKGLLPARVDKALTPHIGRIQRKLGLH
jgi:hypothetical protein